jgi:hypothetical protein
MRSQKSAEARRPAKKRAKGKLPVPVGDIVPCPGCRSVLSSTDSVPIKLISGCKACGVMTCEDCEVCKGCSDVGRPESYHRLDAALTAALTTTAQEANPVPGPTKRAKVELKPPGWQRRRDARENAHEARRASDCLLYGVLGVLLGERFQRWNSGLPNALILIDEI